MPFLDWVGSWPGALLLKESGTAYLFVNAAHILGIGLLLGAILPLDLRLAGLIKGAPLEAVGPFLLRVATVGLVLAVLTGLWLFSVKPKEYAGNAAFLCKLGLLGLALANVALQHWGGQLRSALRGEGVTRRVRISALVSVGLWLSVLLAGRWIGFL
jgi:hypothetical protein